MSTTNDTRAALAAAIARRTEAQESLGAASGALERARSTNAAAQAEVQRLAAEADSAIERHTLRLERWTIGGAAGQPPVLVADVAHLQAQATAQATAKAAAENVKTFQAGENAARAALTAAEQRERSIRDGLRRAEVDRIAKRLAEVRREEFGLAARLAVADLDRHVLTPAGLEALEAPPGRPTMTALFGRGILADIHTPLSGRTTELAAARAHWLAFDATLTDDAPNPEPAAERAA